LLKEPSYQHGDAPKIGVILANLGTPDSLSTHAVRKYLQQFLMDRRVVEVPRFIWCWILHFIILVFRPGSSAKKYAKVWTKKGSPLLVNATNQTTAFTKKIKKAVSIPVMAKARIGHFAEAQILESLGVDYIDESEVLTPADYTHHIDKWNFTVPFVCGATNLGEALRRINEGAAMIRSKGEAGTGDVSNAVTHMRTIGSEIRRLTSMREDELYVAAKELAAPYELVKEVAATGKLPVVLFTAGGIATPADASLMMQLGADGVFIGSGIFKSGNPAHRASACVKATTFYNDPKVVADVSRGLGDAMVGINVADIPVPHRLAERGW